MNIMLRLGGDGALAERSSHLEHHRDPRGIVVGARVELAAPHAQMVEMGRHDDPLVAQLRVRSAQQGTDVAALDGAGLLARDRLDVSAVKQRLELEAAKLLDQVGNRLLSRCSASAAEFGRGQHFHHVPQARLLGSRRLVRLAGGGRPMRPAKMQTRSQTRPRPASRDAVDMSESLRSSPPSLFRESVRLS